MGTEGLGGGMNPLVHCTYKVDSLVLSICVFTFVLKLIEEVNVVCVRVGEEGGGGSFTRNWRKSSSSWSP